MASCVPPSMGVFYRVRTGPGKSLNLKKKYPGLDRVGILLKVLENPGFLNSEKKDCSQILNSKDELFGM